MTRKAQRILTRMAVIAILAVLAHWFDKPDSMAASNEVRVIDGDSLEIGGEKVRLLGIDAPELSQTCTNATGKTYGCGKQATKHLQYLIGKKTVQCDVTGDDKYQRGLVLCQVGDVDINKQMVKSGWALAFRNSYVDYTTEEIAAAKARRGLWAGDFMTPREWKQLHGTYR